MAVDEVNLDLWNADNQPSNFVATILVVVV